jgi:hypothetical protein
MNLLVTGFHRHYAYCHKAESMQGVHLTDDD